MTISCPHSRCVHILNDRYVCVHPSRPSWERSYYVITLTIENIADCVVVTVLVSTFIDCVIEIELPLFMDSIQSSELSVTERSSSLMMTSKNDDSCAPLI